MKWIGDWGTRNEGKLEKRQMAAVADPGHSSCYFCGVADMAGGGAGQDNGGAASGG